MCGKLSYKLVSHCVDGEREWSIGKNELLNSIALIGMYVYIYIYIYIYIYDIVFYIKQIILILALVSSNK